VTSRIVTALILLIIFVPALFWAPVSLWMVLTAGVVGLAGFEWGRIAGFPEPLPLAYAVLLSACSLALGFLLEQQAFHHSLLWLAVAFWTLIVPLWLSWRWEIKNPFILAMVGTIVLLPTWVALVTLRNSGPWILLGVMTVVWIADSAAYFAGRKFGMHKLAPAISPGKTWEGVMGAGIALALYASAISAAIVGLRIAGALFLTASLLYFSILGDLFESWMKRVAGVKDSGKILPGHGGILDRIDALTAALPIGATILLVAKGHL
jgi:phosphatidate cytidylyltransferase